MARKSFSVHSDFYEELLSLPLARCGLLVHHLICWAMEDFHESELLPEDALLFRLMTKQIERISTANSTNGKTGGAPKGNKNAARASETSETSDDEENNPNNPTVPVTVSITDTRITPPNPPRGEAPAGDKPRQKRFVAPTVEEVRAYCAERGNGIDPQLFVDHYTANGWMRGKNPVKDWKGCVRYWEGKRREEGRQPSGAAGPIPKFNGDAGEDWDNL